MAGVNVPEALRELQASFQRLETLAGDQHALFSDGRAPEGARASDRRCASPSGKEVLKAPRPRSSLQGGWETAEFGARMREVFDKVDANKVDSCITQLKAQGPSRTCNESNAAEKKEQGSFQAATLGPTGRVDAVF